MKQIKLRNKLQRAALEGNLTDSHVWAMQSREDHAANNSPALTQERPRKTNSRVGPIIDISNLVLNFTFLE